MMVHVFVVEFPVLLEFGRQLLQILRVEEHQLIGINPLLPGTVQLP